ncbi:MAG: hypothetical protein RL481_1556, partial [Pseudomonadota bacterium]
MAISMYHASVPVLARALENLIGVLEKGKAHAADKGTDEANFVTMRLIPDMLPLASQVRIATDVAKRGISRLAGVEPPSHPDDETDFDQLIARCHSVIAYINGFSPEQIDGSEEKEILLPTPFGEMKFTGQQFLFGFMLSNV